MNAVLREEAKLNPILRPLQSYISSVMGQKQGHKSFMDKLIYDYGNRNLAVKMKRNATDDLKWPQSGTNSSLSLKS